MKKKRFLSLLLLPLTLVSCGKSGVPFSTIKKIVEGISDTPLFPYYRVRGSIDFINRYETDIDVTFDQSPSEEAPVPYARYNDGYFIEALDVKDENIVIYGISSRSYFLRAPLRITKSNFYTTVPDDVGSGIFNNIKLASAKYNANTRVATLGAIGDHIEGAKATFLDPNDLDTLTMTYTEDSTSKTITLLREGSMKEGVSCIFDGNFTDGVNYLTLKQGESENLTCAHAILQSLITSYYMSSGSVNPSNNYMTYETLPDGGFAFVGNKVHTKIKVDNCPYYPDPARHPEVEVSNDDPLPCYNNTVNAKVNIRFEYNKDGWLVKESMTSLDYSHSSTNENQISLTTVYTYKFSD